MVNVALEMKHLRKLAGRDPCKRFNRLWPNVRSETWLTQAWEEIRRNQGSQTPGVDQQTAADITPQRITSLAQRLRNQTYRPTPVRRVHIPKANGKTRPLGIPTVEDRIVQQALRMVLEPIFEADFLACSHGFRQGHSPHTALRDVANRYPNVSWIIEGDIVGCFDNIPHGKLMRGIQRRIADEKILALVKAFLKAGYMTRRAYHKTYSGTPQGGIISPLLCNIFLHQLDEMMVHELEANPTQTEQDKRRRENPGYKRLVAAISYTRKKLATYPPSNEKRQLVQKLRELRKKLKQTPCYAANKWHKGKVFYVRYADDFVVLVNGPKADAEAVQRKVKIHLATMGLELSEEKTKLTHWSKVVHFLGYHIHGEPGEKGNLIRAYLSIPKEKARQIRKDIQRVARYYHIPEMDAMVSMGSKYRGWCNYYRYANAAQTVFQRLSHHTWWHYAHFLARKHKTSIKQMFVREKKAGRCKVIQRKDRSRSTFTIPSGKKEVVLDIFPPKTVAIRAVVGKEWEVDLKPVNPLSWQRGQSLETRLAAIVRSDGLCIRCGENPIAHVHHKAKLKTKRSFKARVASDAAQKDGAEALCYECHLDTHHGNWRT